MKNVKKLKRVIFQLCGPINLNRLLNIKVEQSLF